MRAHRGGAALLVPAGLPLVTAVNFEFAVGLFFREYALDDGPFAGIELAAPRWTRQQGFESNFKMPFQNVIPLIREGPMPYVAVVGVARLQMRGEL